MPRGAALDFSTPAMRQQTRSRSAPPVVIARAAPCAPVNAPPVAQAEEVTESSDAPMPTGVATAVPADDDVEAAIQRRDCEAAVAQVRATTLQITTQEQKLLNYRKSVTVWKSTSVAGAPDNSSLSHSSAMTRPTWLGRAARNRHRADVASMAWRTTR